MAFLFYWLLATDYWLLLVEIRRATLVTFGCAVERGVFFVVLGGLKGALEFGYVARDGVEIILIETLILARDAEHFVDAAAHAVKSLNLQLAFFDGFHDGVARGDEVGLLLADEDHVGARLDGAQGGFGDREGLDHRTHLHVVRDDETVEFQSLAQELHDDVAADRGWQLVYAFERRKLARAPEPRLQKFGNLRERAMTDHHRVQALARTMKHQVHEGHQVALENLIPGVSHHGQAAVRIDARSAESRKMFAASDDAPLLQAVKVSARQSRNLRRV